MLDIWCTPGQLAELEAATARLNLQHTQQRYSLLVYAAAGCIRVTGPQNAAAADLKQLTCYFPGQQSADVACQQHLLASQYSSMLDPCAQLPC
jgi:hypothetical protein